MPHSATESSASVAPAGPGRGVPTSRRRHRGSLQQAAAKVSQLLWPELQTSIARVADCCVAAQRVEHRTRRLGRPAPRKVPGQAPADDGAAGYTTPTERAHARHPLGGSAGIVASVRSTGCFRTRTVAMRSSRLGGRPAPASRWRPRSAVRRRAIVRVSADRNGSHGRRWSSPPRRSRTAISGRRPRAAFGHLRTVNTALLRETNRRTHRAVSRVLLRLWLSRPSAPNGSFGCAQRAAVHRRA